jgi:hypothetical protein
MPLGSERNSGSAVKFPVITTLLMLVAAMARSFPDLSHLEILFDVAPSVEVPAGVILQAVKPESARCVVLSGPSSP